MTTEFRIASLADHPHAAPVLAHWCYDAWGRDDGLTLQHELDRYARAVDSTRAGTVPLVMIALDGDTVIGCAQLKTEQVFDFPQKTYWLGPVYVAAPYRGNELASQLIAAIVQCAQQHGVTQLHLQTEMFSGGLYSKLGWEPMFRAETHGVQVLVMRRELLR